MLQAVAYPDDRRRLLRFGRMCEPVYSGRDPLDVARDSWQRMQEVAALMALGVSEPTVETGDPDYTGARIVTTWVGVYDLLPSREG